MILIDTSAWVEFLRDTRTPVCVEVDRLLGLDIATTDAVLMEVLAGARDERHLRNLRALLGVARMVHSQPQDFDLAAQLYRRCRRQGETVRRLVDCLIAAVAIRHRTPVLHSDNDYNVLARHTALAIHII
ncbi:MAG: PIN domain nuclease [Candidatus Dormibacteraeota bacterium]|nr:PIN domain nuclease [Candidatus Dormibacteraeota bacterium]